MLQCTLTFDTAATDGDVDALFVRPLTKLAMIIDPNGPENKRRPPLVRVKWSLHPASDIIGVITSVATTFTTFLPSGVPVGAVLAEGPAWSTSI